MLPSEERIFEAKAERYFQGQRELPNGRNFLCFVERFHKGDAQKNYDMGMCRTFPDAPGSRMCGACDIDRCDMRRPYRLEDFEWVAEAIRRECPEVHVETRFMDHSSNVVIRIDDCAPLEVRKNRMFYLTWANGNILALSPVEQKGIIDKQVALWKFFIGQNT